MVVDSRVLSILWIALLLLVIQDVTARRSKPFNVLTFNADLTPATSQSIVDGTDINASRVARRDALISALRKSPADLICLQEIYFGPDMEAIVSGLSSLYRYSFSSLHQNGILPQQVGVTIGPVCPTTLPESINCLEVNNCTIIEQLSAFQACAAQKCGSFVATEVLPSGGKCVACASFNLPDTAKVQDVCTSIGDPANNLDINPAGLLMLSKRPLSNTRFVDLFEGTPVFFSRGYLQATFYKKFKAVCSHLSSTVPPYIEPFVNAKLGFTSYREQNLFEAQQIVNTFKDDKKVVIAIDLNSGLNFSLPDIRDRIPETYNAMTAVFNTRPVRECTTCRDNTFRAPTIDNGIDQHVFTGPGLKSITAKSAEKFTFGNTQIDYSDHYGAMVKVKCKSGRKRKNKKNN